MSLGIMQPYLLPYIGYFQLIAAVDRFVIYDNVEYTKKGWINRNRMLVNQKASTFTIPIKKASDKSLISEREVSNDFNSEKLLNKIHGAYSKAPYFSDTYSLLQKILAYESENLFDFLAYSLNQTLSHLDMSTTLIASSSLPVDRTLKGERKVMAICKAVGEREYINPVGGAHLYNKAHFQREGLDLKFIRPLPIKYCQFDDLFEPSLSILDVMMFNAVTQVREMVLENYELV